MRVRRAGAPSNDGSLDTTIDIAVCMFCGAEPKQTMTSARTTEHRRHVDDDDGNSASTFSNDLSYATDDQSSEPEALTLRQVQVLRCVEDALAVQGYPPTRRELCAMLGITSQPSLAAHLRLLEVYGFIRLDKGVGRGIVVLISSSRARLSTSRGRRPGLTKTRSRPLVAETTRVGR